MSIYCGSRERLLSCRAICGSWLLMAMNSIRLRRKNGSSLAELGPALFLVFIILIFPMGTLASIGLRYSFLIMTVRGAAREAAKCKQFQADANAYQISAKNASAQTVARYLQRFGGINVTNNRTYIQIYNKTSQNITFSDVPLNTIDEQANVYNIGVALTAQVEPLFRNSSAKWGTVPGLTAPFPITAVAAAVAENPSGLNK